MINPAEDRGQTLHALVVAARLSLSQTLYQDSPYVTCAHWRKPMLMTRHG